MKLSDLPCYATRLGNTTFAFHHDLFSKPIWGDMGEDCASITLTTNGILWQLSYIRTQNGEPYPLADTVSNLIDQYEKELNHDQVYDYLSMHRLLPEFQEEVERFLQHDQ